MLETNTSLKESLSNRILSGEFIGFEEDITLLSYFKVRTFEVYGIEAGYVSSFIFDTAFKIAKGKSVDVIEQQLELIESIPDIALMFDEYDQVKRTEDSDPSNFKAGDVIKWCDQLYEVVENYGTYGEVKEFGELGELIIRFHWSVGDDHSTLVHKSVV